MAVNHQHDGEQPILDEASLKSLGRNIGVFFEKLSSGPDSPVHAQKQQLQLLLATADVPQLPPSHRVAACNALCAFVDCCRKHDDPKSRQLVLSAEVTLTLLQIYLDRFSDARGKSMKQLLDTFTGLLSLFPTAKEPAVVTLISIISGSEADTVKSKPALHVLSALLVKKLVDVDVLMNAFSNIEPARLQGQYHDRFRAEEEISMLKCVLKLVAHPHVAPVAGTFFYLMADVLERTQSKTPDSSCLPSWITALEESILSYPESFDTFKACVLPDLFKLNSHAYQRFLLHIGLERLGDMSELGEDQDEREKVRRMILFAALQTGKERGLVQETEDASTSISISGSAVLIPEKIIVTLLTHNFASAQLFALSTSISSHLSTRPFSVRILQCLLRVIPPMHSNTDAHFRGEVLSMEQILVDRLRASSTALKRDVEKEQQAFGNRTQIHGLTLKEKLFKAHFKFTNDYLAAMTHELQPNSSYQRHICALKTLSFLMRSGLDPIVSHDLLSKSARRESKWPFSISIMTPKVQRLLLDLLLDAFDDVRLGALTLLKLYQAAVPNKSPELSGSSHFETSLQRANSIMLRTGRVDHADGVARNYDLLCQTYAVRGQFKQVETLLKNLVGSIEAAIGLGEVDLLAAATKMPLHGMFTSLRYCISSLMQHGKEFASIVSWLYPRLESSVAHIWRITKHILCDDAPEGFLPSDLEDDSGMTTKDILSYAWRAIKESSLLMREIVTSLLPALFTAEETTYKVKTLGNLAFEQLSDLRHRGAFSIVAQTFAVICIQCHKTGVDGDRQLIKDWYQQTLELVVTKGNMTTRRSAGIPTLFTAVLAADVDSDRFAGFVSDMQAIIEQPRLQQPSVINDLPQVHALNSLKAAFTSTKLGLISGRYVVPIMRLAASCLTSEIWALRNCGLMLFRSLVDRLLGPVEAIDNASVSFYDSSRFVYSQYPGLLDLLVGMLDEIRQSAGYSVSASNTSTSEASAEAIFPVLDFLRRAPAPSFRLSSVRLLVEKFLSHDNWHVRAITAQAYISNLREDEAVDALHALLHKGDTSLNARHGSLLCAKNIVQAILTDFSKLKKAHDLPNRILHIVADTIHVTDPTRVTPIIESAQADVVWMSCVLGLRLNKGSDGLLPQFYRIYLQQFIASLETSSPLKVNFPGLATLQRLRISLLLLSLASEGETSLIHEEKIRRLQADDTTAIEFAVTCVGDALLSESRQQSCANFAALLVFLTSQGISVGVSTAVHTVLANLLDCYPPDLKSEGKNLMLFRRIRSLEDHWQAASSPSEAVGILRVWGHWIEARRAASATWTPALLQGYEHWIQSVRAAIDESQEFNVRLAAIQSLNSVLQLWTSTPQLPSELLVEGTFVIYDALNDDDDEIRLLAAQAAGKICANTPSTNKGLQSTSPPLLATQRLYRYLVDHHSSTPSLISGSLCRLIGQSFEKVDTFTPVVDVLSKILVEDDSLFAVEKQNLYIDEVRDARQWAKVLQLLPIAGLGKDRAANFTEWVCSGLENLIQKAKDEYDGPLGWTSKPDAFILGMRVIHGAEVALAWRAKSRLIPCRGSQMRMLLARLAEVGAKQGLHELWLQEIEGVIERSVMRKMERISHVLKTLPTSLNNPE